MSETNVTGRDKPLESVATTPRRHRPHEKRSRKVPFLRLVGAEGKTANASLHRQIAPAKEAKLSRQYKPDHLNLEEWQTQLRRQFGREQKFKLENVGHEAVFSEFRVTNPQSGGCYRVVIRGMEPGTNFCACPDFATNTLGTCKHIEYVLAKLARKPGGKKNLQAGFNPPFSEIFLKYGAQRQVCFHAGAECPVGLITLASKYFDSSGILYPEAYAQFERLLARAVRYKHDLRCYDDALGFIAEVRDRDVRRQRVDEAFPRDIRSPAFDRLLKADLYDYQRQGALFAARAGRCILGDEMGLGKTIQALAAVEIMARQLAVARVLIVCPTSLKHQWEREIGRFTLRSAGVINGLQARRQELFATETFYKVTNYDTVYRDLDLIRVWAPDLVILDEAQRIKNWNTRAARSVKKIVSPYAIVLTGTPLENRLEELVSLVDFVDRHRLGPTFRFLANHQILAEDTGRVVGYRNLNAIGQTLEPILLRRQKDQVLKQLPARLDKNFFVRMTPEQMQHHEDNREIVARIVAKWRRFRFLSEADQRRLLVALQNMRMSCNSTYLLDQNTDFGFKADELVTLLGEIGERQDAKAVVFSQWLRTHELISRRLKKQGSGHVLFHGGVPGPQRKGLVDRFREDPACRTFLATDAGGVGLNLQHASVVVNMDLPWNPAVLEQRIGRVHRLGQIRPVQVVNFIAQGTIEESMLGLLKFKKSLFSGALDGGEKEVFLGGSRLTRFMEMVDRTASAIPASPPSEPQLAGEPPAPREDAAAQSPPAASAQQAPPRPAPSAEAWFGFLQTGLTLLEQLATAARSGMQAGTTPADDSTWVRRDPATGQPYVHLPLPSAEVLDRFLDTVGNLVRAYRPK